MMRSVFRREKACQQLAGTVGILAARRKYTSTPDLRQDQTSAHALAPAPTGSRQTERANKSTESGEAGMVEQRGFEPPARCHERSALPAPSYSLASRSP